MTGVHRWEVPRHNTTENGERYDDGTLLTLTVDAVGDERVGEVAQAQSEPVAAAVENTGVLRARMLGIMGSERKGGRTYRYSLAIGSFSGLNFAARRICFPRASAHCGAQR